MRDPPYARREHALRELCGIHPTPGGNTPYASYGTLSTQLNWLSPTPQGGHAEPQFFALAATPAQSAELPLRIGMTGEARVLTGRRTLLELALEPMRALRERQFR